MKSNAALISAATLLAMLVSPSVASADENAAVNGCIKQLKTVGGPDAQNGIEILNTDYSEAGTIVMMRDAGETVWRCIGYKDGAVGELVVSQAAEDGEGAIAGAEPGTGTERVQFDAGTSGTELTATLTPGSSMRYVLGAKNEQFLYVRVAPQGTDIDYQIFNPDDSLLLDQISSDKEYRGQLWQSGDHIIEVINRGNQTTSYNVTIGIE